MTSAIETLNETLRRLVENEKYCREAGDVEQAEKDAADAAEVRQALAVLRAAYAGPIWPQPSCAGAAGSVTVG